MTITERISNMGFILLVPVLLSLATCKVVDETVDRVPVFWPQTASYQKKARLFSINENQALAILQASIPIGMSRVFDKKPLFIVGDCYVFGFMHDKTSAPLEGYYVNGMTCHVEYRKSDLQLRQVGFRATSVPKACYSSVIGIGTDSSSPTRK